MILSAAKAEADVSAHAATAQAAIVFQRAPRWIPSVLVIRSSLLGFAVLACFARDDDQPSQGYVLDRMLANANFGC